MKTITYIMALISVALLLCLSVSASLASTSQISPGLEVISASAGMTVSAVRGNSVVFEKTFCWAEAGQSTENKAD